MISSLASKPIQMCPLDLLTAAVLLIKHQLSHKVLNSMCNTPTWIPAQDVHVHISKKGQKLLFSCKVCRAA